MVKQKESLQQEIEELENKPDHSITVKERERLTKAREELAKLNESEKNSTLKDRIYKNVFQQAKNDRLGESFYEVERKSKKFEGRRKGEKHPG